MRLVRMCLILTVLGGIGWVFTRSVRVESTDSQVQITIDRHKLRQAGSDLKSKGRRAVGKVGQALEQAGQTLDDEPEEATFFQR